MMTACPFSQTDGSLMRFQTDCWTPECEMPGLCLVSKKRISPGCPWTAQVTERDRRNGMVLTRDHLRFTHSSSNGHPLRDRHGLCNLRQTCFRRLPDATSNSNLDNIALRVVTVALFPRSDSMYVAFYRSVPEHVAVPAVC
jgi:hypothetical protein